MIDEYRNPLAKEEYILTTQGSYAIMEKNTNKERLS